MDEDFLKRKLAERRAEGAFRELKLINGKTDFCSNDYLGIVRNRLIEAELEKSSEQPEKLYGSTGSRLLSGNYELIERFETELASFHEAEAALIFNSGYDANVGLLSAVPQRGDTILYDQLCHASIRDGMRLSLASSFSFTHNDPDELEKKISGARGRTFVVTESVFSMDGEKAPLKEMAALCEKFGALLIVDEAHATGIIGDQGAGLVQTVDVADKCFARVYTFGKALGAHGAAVLGSRTLIEFLINFSRPFIFTTALPASSVLAASAAYSLMRNMKAEREELQSLVFHFHQQSESLRTIDSQTPIQAVVIPGNDKVKHAAEQLQKQDFDVRAILHPTVPAGSERLRIVLHAHNTHEEISSMLTTLKKVIV